MLHQLVAGFRLGDAISNEAVRIRDLCAAHGLDSDIRCPPKNASEDDRHLTLPVDSLPEEVKPEDTALLHLSIGSRCNAVFPTLPCRRVILYHNVTPSKYFDLLSPRIARTLADGRAQVAALRDAAHANWADSKFNATELEQMGFANVHVLPLLFDTCGPKSGPIHQGMFSRLSDPPTTNLLFVGRLAPNKRHDKLLAIFAAYIRAVDPGARLVIVGGSGEAEAYKALLMGSAYELVAKNVMFTEFLDDPKLRACYASASAFVCASDHEGFCAPLLEAMAWRIPVFAAAACAVPETMDGAGVLFSPAAAPEAVAEVIGRVLGDPALKEAVLKRQDERLARFRARDEWAELQPLLKG